MRVLVTGGAGFIGSHVVESLLARKHEVVTLDNLSAGRANNIPPSVTLIRMDLGHRAEVHQALLETKPDAVIHLAAQKSVATSVSDPIFDAQENILASLNLFEAAKNAGVHKLVFASTGGALYGDDAPLPTPEEHETLPESPYGVAKLAIEHYLRFYRKNHGMQVVSMRMANVYGPRQDPRGEAGVVAIFCSKALKGETAHIYGDGLQTRDYTFVKDVAEAFADALEQGDSMTVNIGTGRETSVLDLVDALELIVGQAISREHHEGRIGEIRRSCLCADLAQEKLGWTANTGLHSGLAETVRFFRDQK
ncbi:MAG: NAD-dependent epimerase/dehydratase family protein [Fimbriimonadaceae bacterium]